MVKKYDITDNVERDNFNPGDKVWYIKDNRYIASVISLTINNYLIAYYDTEWLLIETDYDSIVPRTITTDTIELFDKVYINSQNSKTFGVVIGYEFGQYVVSAYSEKIWLRLNVHGSQLERCEDDFDKILFDNRKILLEQLGWIKWNLHG